MKISSFLTVAILGATILMSGCANRGMQGKHSGFLKSYDHLEDNDELEGTKVYITPGSDFTKYENIYIPRVKVISAIPDSELTAEQKILFDKISEYLTQGYKKSLKEGTGYRLVEDKTIPKTLSFEVAVSAVEVHYDDMQWYQFTPITLGLTAVARATYVDGAVRILGEGRIVDLSNGKVLLRGMRLQKGQEVTTDGNKLLFKDVKPGLDVWLKKTNMNLAKLRKGIIKVSKTKK